VNTIEKELAEMMAWIRKIGDEIGADKRYFRSEGAGSDASALPPPARYIAGEAGNLRLYCLVANRHVVFLYSGGIKTAITAQNCPNISACFRLANTLTKLIDQAFKDQDIRWNDSSDDIVYDDDLELPL